MTVDEERRLILKMVEEKKISADEAVELLKALEALDEGEAGARRPAGGGRPERLRDVAELGRELADRIAAESERWERVGEEIAERVSRRVSFFGFPFFGFGPRAEVVKEWSHPAPEGGVLALAVATRNGAVRVVGEERADVYVRLQCAAQAATQEAAEAFAQAMGHVEWRGGTLVVRDEEAEGAGVWGGRRMCVRIFVPKGVAVKGRVESRNGSLGLHGLAVAESGRLELATTNGHVELGQVTGGPVEMRTANGSVRIRGVDADLTARTTNGSVRAQLDPPGRDRSVDLRTVNGSIRVVLPDAGGLAVEAEARAGSVKSEIPELGPGSRHGAGRRLEGQREGTPRLSLTAVTRNGSVRLLRPASDEGEEVAAGG